MTPEPQSATADLETLRDQAPKTLFRRFVGDFCESKLAVFAFLAFLAIGQPAIVALFGAEFTPVFWPALAFLLLTFWGLGNTTVIPRLWAMDGHRHALVLQAIASFAHVAALIPLAMHFGLPGVVGSYTVYHVVFRGIGAIVLRHKTREAELAQFSDANEGRRLPDEGRSVDRTRHAA